MRHKKLLPKESPPPAPVTEFCTPLNHMKEMKTGVKLKIESFVDNLFGFIQKLSPPNEPNLNLPVVGLSSQCTDQSSESHLRMPQHGEQCVCCSCTVDSVKDLFPESRNVQLEDLLEDKDELTEIVNHWQTNSDSPLQSYPCFVHPCEAIYTKQEYLDKHVAEEHPNSPRSKIKIEE